MIIGVGDCLMSIGEAKRLHRQTGQQVMIVDRRGRPVQSDLFDGVPYLTTKPTRTAYQRLLNCSGVRPYIGAKTHRQWTWLPYQPEPADVVFTPEELAFAAPYRDAIMFEPNVKDIGHRNKDWGWSNWLSLVGHALDDIEYVIQVGREGDRFLPHVRHVIAPTFRQALAVLSVCRAYVGPEGGLHHGAAAVGTPAVVIFGGFISPDITGYPQHRNLYAGGRPCGMRINCPHCRTAMSRIRPATVLSALKGILDG